MAWLLLCGVTLFLYLVGTAESFLEPVDRFLFHTVKVLSWVGMVGCWVVLVPVHRKRRFRLVSAGLLGVSFTLILVLVFLWGSWVYPHEGFSLW